MAAGPSVEQQQLSTPFALTGNVTAESVTDSSITHVNPNVSKTSFQCFKSMFIHTQL